MSAWEDGTYRLLPGRLRIEIRGLRHNKKFAVMIKTRLQNLPGVTQITVNSLTGRALLAFTPELLSPETIKAEIRNLQSIEDISLSGKTNDRQDQVTKKPQDQAASGPDMDELPDASTALAYTVASGGALAALIAKRILGRQPSTLAVSEPVFYLAAMTTLLSGYPLLKSGLNTLAKRHRVNVDLLLFIVTVGLLAVRESITGLAILWVVHLSHFFQHFMQTQSQQSIYSLLQAKQRQVRRITDTASEWVDPDQLAKEDLIYLENGELLPVDGVIVKGGAAINQAVITGKCRLKLKQPGDRVLAGSTVQTGQITLRVIGSGAESSLIPILSLTEAAAASHTVGPPLPFIYTARMMAYTVGIAGFLFLLTRDFRRSLAVLLAGCPVGLSVARTSARGAALAQAAQGGIYVKDGKYFEAASQVDTVLFDKTGTLTEAIPKLYEIIPYSKELTQRDLLQIAASAEQQAEHPLAVLFLTAAEQQEISLLKPERTEVLSGSGITAVFSGQTYRLGNETLMITAGIDTSRSRGRAMRCEHFGQSVLYLAKNNMVIGIFSIQDKLRQFSKTAVDELRAIGIQPVLITGDNPYTADAVCDELGIQERYSAMLPRDKLQVIGKMQQANRRILMVGDGINDTPALAASHVGVAMGRNGASAALYSAHVVISGDDPRSVSQLLRLARRTGEVVRQNYALATGLNAVGIALAALRLLNPVSASLFLNLSLAAVLLNSARLLPVKQKVPFSKLDLQRFAAPHLPVDAVGIDQESVSEQSPSDKDQQYCYYVLNSDAVCEMLQTSAHFGLSNCEAKLRCQTRGANVLAQGKKVSAWDLIKAQFKDVMVQVLLGAAVLSLMIGKSRDALLTILIVAANAVIGVVQDKRAGKSIEALRKLSAPQTKVIRGGHSQVIPARELVPGDVIVLEAGDKVPADCRLIVTNHLEIEEASLTGETVPVKKNHGSLTGQSPVLGDLKNMIFMGTSVTRGRATAVVVQTGMNTEMGKIATLIEQNGNDVTPLQRRLAELARYLVYGCIGVSFIVFLSGVLRGGTLLGMLQTAATLAVAAIPEGLTATVMIALAMGVQRMSKHNIIVRELSSIETLGCATVICSDKTGTLTKNEMTVRAIYTGGKEWDVSGEGYEPCGEFSLEGEVCRPLDKHSDLYKTLLIGALCNNAQLISGKAAKQDKVVCLHPQQADNWKINGDPTEGALVVAAAKAGLDRKVVDKFKRLEEFPFESERRMMSVVCAGDGKEPILYAKGAPDSILTVCTHYLQAGRVIVLDDATRAKIGAVNDQLAGKALRVLACAYRRLDMAVLPTETEGIEFEHDLVFSGLMGMIDPPRAEVPQAIAICRRAGVKVIMITGDHPHTAKAVACELGLISDDSQVLLGKDIDAMSDSELAAVVDKVLVYARTSPHHKLRLVKALQDKGYVVGMTGDGVNDAPAVKAADIGIAMGIMGTDVTKEAASMTLADDNFATIVRAMQEGRSIYANIRKAIRYLLATNIGEVVLMLLAALAGMPLPLIPIQLLWINLVGDGLPSVALVNDPPSADIMQQQPRSASQSVFAGGLGRKIISRGLIIGIMSLAVYNWKLSHAASLAAARTLVLAQLAISQFIHIFDCRLEKESGKASLFSNGWLIGAVTLSMILVVGIIHIPSLQPIFGTVALTSGEWLIALLAAAVTSVADLSLEAILEKKAFPKQARIGTTCQA